MSSEDECDCLAEGLSCVYDCDCNHCLRQEKELVQRKLHPVGFIMGRCGGPLCQCFRSMCLNDLSSKHLCLCLPCEEGKQKRKEHATHSQQINLQKRHIQALAVEEWPWQKPCQGLQTLLQWNCGLQNFEKKKQRCQCFSNRCLNEQEISVCDCTECQRQSSYRRETRLKEKEIKEKIDLRTSLRRQIPFRNWHDKGKTVSCPGTFIGWFHTTASHPQTYQPTAKYIQRTKNCLCTRWDCINDLTTPENAMCNCKVCADHKRLTHRQEKLKEQTWNDTLHKHLFLLIHRRYHQKRTYLKNLFQSWYRTVQDLLTEATGEDVLVNLLKYFFQTDSGLKEMSDFRRCSLALVLNYSFSFAVSKNVLLKEGIISDLVPIIHGYVGPEILDQKTTEGRPWSIPEELESRIAAITMEEEERLEQKKIEANKKKREQAQKRKLKREEQKQKVKMRKLNLTKPMLE